MKNDFDRNQRAQVRKQNDKLASVPLTDKLLSIQTKCGRIESSSI